MEIGSGRVRVVGVGGENKEVEWRMADADRG